MDAFERLLFFGLVPGRELRQRVDAVQRGELPFVVEFLEVFEQILAGSLVGEHHDDGVVLREPGLGNEGVRSVAFVLDLGLAEVIEELEVIPAVYETDKAHYRDDGDKNLVDAVREQLEAVLPLEAERVDRERLSSSVL